MVSFAKNQCGDCQDIQMDVGSKLRSITRRSRGCSGFDEPVWKWFSMSCFQLGIGSIGEDVCCDIVGNYGLESIEVEVACHLQFYIKLKLD